MGGVVLFASFCAYYSYQVLHRATLKNVQRRALLEVQQGVNNMDRWISTHRAAVQTIASSPISQSKDWSILGPYLQTETSRISDFVFLGFANPKGQRITTADHRFINAADRQWFQRAIAGQTYVDHPFISRALKIPTIAISAPIFDMENNSRSPIGVIHGAVKVDRIVQMVDQLHYGKNSYAFLLDHEGRAIVHPDKTLMSTEEHQAPRLQTSAQPDLARIAQQMVNRQQGIDRIQLDDKTVYISYLSLKSANWSVGLVIPKDEIDQQLRQLDMIALVVVGLTGLVLMVLWRVHNYEQHQQQKAKQTAILQAQQQAAQQRAAELTRINEALNRNLGTLTADPEINDFLSCLLAELAQQIGACKTHLFLYDAKTHTLNQHSTVQEGHVHLGMAPTDPDLFQHPIPADLNGKWQAIMDAPRPLYCSDLDAPEALKLAWTETLPWHQKEGHETLACARMRAGEQLIGYIGFSFRERTDLSDERLEFIQALTNQATLAIQLTRLAEQSQNDALAVALTNERNRLAREIHDILAQAFTGISLQLEAAKGILTDKPDAAQIHLGKAGMLARQGLSEARRSVRALRTQALETGVLAEALQNSLLEMTQDTPLQAHFQLQGTPIALSDDLQLNLLRIGQEAITNALRHAQAQTLTLTLAFTSEQIGLSIVDDGIGFDPQALMDMSGFGLVGIRERAAHFSGHLQLTSGFSKGTIIDVTIPLDGQPALQNVSA